MRILQVINSLGTGGAEKLLLDTIPLYRKAGIEMDILLLWDNDFPFTKTLRGLGCCKIYILKKSTNYKDIYNPSAIFKMRKILKGYDIAHVHLFPAQYFVALATVFNKNKTKLVFTEHCTSNSRLKNRIFKPLEQIVYKRYAEIICITKEIKDIYKNYLTPKSPIGIIHNGVDITKFRESIPLARLLIEPNIKEEDFLLVQVSAFRKQKDQATLIRALLYLPEYVKLLLIGVGENLQTCKLLVSSLKLEQRVFFLGQRMDVSALLKAADIVVLSSKYEGLSLSCIEGMASGKPFIASDVPGLTEVVNGAGVLFPQGDEQVLAKEIDRLMQDRGYYNQIVQRCEDRAGEYDIDKMLEKHIELYTRVYKKSSI